MRGLRIGGGYRPFSKMPVGRYRDRSVQCGPSYWDSSAMLGGRLRTRRLPWLKRRNLRRIRVRDPRTWRLTANFDFQAGG